jgi:hypothetical protein
MAPKFCPRCGGWIMQGSTDATFTESTCIVCGWVVYHDSPEWQRMLSPGHSPKIAKNQATKDSRRP